jgi:hypothetical protein
MKSKKFYSIISLIAVIALSGCSLYNNSHSSYDKSVDFSKYETYAWLNSQKSQAPTPYYNDVIENNAKTYVDRYFKDRGYNVDTSKPDVLLELVLKSKKKTEEIETGNPYNYSNYKYNNYSYNPAYNNNLYYGNQYHNLYPNYSYITHYSYNPGYRTKTRKYTESMITINVIDRVSNKMIWTGSSENDMYDQAYIEEIVHPALVNILKQYPVKSIEKSSPTK